MVICLQFGEMNFSLEQDIETMLLTCLTITTRVRVKLTTISLQPGTITKHEQAGNQQW